MYYAYVVNSQYYPMFGYQGDPWRPRPAEQIVDVGPEAPTYPGPVNAPARHYGILACAACF